MNETGKMTGDDLFHLIESDHARAHALVREIEACRLPQERDALFPRLREAIETHALAVEEVLYPRLGEISALESTVARQKAELAQVRDCVEVVGAMSARDTAWDTPFRALVRALERHADEEEGRIFPRMREEIGSDELDGLGRKFAEARRTLAAVAA